MSRIKWIATITTATVVLGIMVLTGWHQGREREIGSGMERKNFIRCAELAKRQKSEVSVMNDAVQKFSKETEAGDGLGQFELFEDMDYALFLETDTWYDCSGSYYRYGIFDRSVKSRKEGEELYFTLHEKLFGKRPEIAGYGKSSEETEDRWTDHHKWADNKEEIITDISTDMEWVITREYEKTVCHGYYVERWYHDADLVQKIDGHIGFDIRNFTQIKLENDAYDPIPHKNMETAEKRLIQDYGENRVKEYFENCYCIGAGGKLIAIAVEDEEIYDSGIGIAVYSIEEDDAKPLYYFERPSEVTEWPIEISQIEGDRDGGWLVFAQGDSTYKLAYPGGEMEKIGEFMYSVSYSPDGRYRAYCTANDVLTDDWLEGRLWKEPYYTDFLSRWNEIPQGWYVEELSTGKKAYIPMPVWSDARPLKGGRCVWIDRSKLHEIIGD